MPVCATITASYAFAPAAATRTGRGQGKREGRQCDRKHTHDGEHTLR